MVIKTVQPDASYERVAFQEAVQSYFGLEELVEEVKKDPNDEQLIRLAGELLRDQQDYYINAVGNVTGILRHDLGFAKTLYQGELVGHLDTHFEEVVSDITGNDLRKIVTNLEYISVGDETLDKISETIATFKEFAKIIKDKDERAMDQYIGQRLSNLESSRDPQDRFILGAYVSGKNIPGYIQTAFNPYFREVQIDFQEALESDEKLHRLVSENYSKGSDNLKKDYVGTVLGSFAPTQETN